MYVSLSFFTSIAYPRRTSVTQDLSAMEGSNITLPCNVERPFLNMYTVTWTVNGERMDPLPSEVFDLELTNVESSAMYECHVESSINEPNPGADAITIIRLTVTPSHSKSHIITHDYIHNGHDDTHIITSPTTLNITLAHRSSYH